MIYGSRLEKNISKIYRSYKTFFIKLEGNSMRRGTFPDFLVLPTFNYPFLLEAKSVQQGDVKRGYKSLLSPNQRKWFPQIQGANTMIVVLVWYVEVDKYVVYRLVDNRRGRVYTGIEGLEQCLAGLTGYGG